MSAAADSTLRIWNLDTGELVNTLAAHTGAITCFVHDEFKVLSGSDGNLKMWDVREGGVVRDLLAGVQGVWQVVSEGRWCVAASNRGDRTVLDVWDFGRVEGEGEEEEEDGGEGEGEDGWVGEVVGGVYDDDVFGEVEEEEEEHKGKRKVDSDAMDLDEEMASGSGPRFYGHRRRVASEGEQEDMRVVEGLVGGGVGEWATVLVQGTTTSRSNTSSSSSSSSLSLVLGVEGSGMRLPPLSGPDDSPTRQRIL